VWVMSLTSYVWGKELKVSILHGDRHVSLLPFFLLAASVGRLIRCNGPARADVCAHRYKFLSMVGFLVNSFGILRAGFQTAKSSEPGSFPSRPAPFWRCACPSDHLCVCLCGVCLVCLVRTSCAS
jgi:hypothetical protein